MMYHFTQLDSNENEKFYDRARSIYRTHPACAAAGSPFLPPRAEEGLRFSHNKPDANAKRLLKGTVDDTGCVHTTPKRNPMMKLKADSDFELHFAFFCTQIVSLTGKKDVVSTQNAIFELTDVCGFTLTTSTSLEWAVSSAPTMLVSWSTKWV